ITCKELSGVLNVSIRSTKNYINEINILSKTKIVYSSNNGYTINKENANKLIKESKDSLPQTADERMIYIIKQLLIEHSSSINLFALCDTLFISYSTIKADISKMNKAYSNFNVQFVSENDELKIVGTEKDKRRLVSHVVFEETNNQFIDINILKKSFKNVPIDKISQIIMKTFKKYNYYINDFAFINLLLHFVIIINRIIEGNSVSNAKNEFFVENDQERNLLDELSSIFEEEFNINFNKNEQFEIYMLFKTNANYSSTSSNETLKKIVGEDIFNLTNDIVSKVTDAYLIDLSSESFLTPFALHLKNLIIRAKNKIYIKNPMTQTIKTSCPMVYDIAIFVSLELIKRYSFEINEDEVTFLALHIGAEIEREKTNENKIKCVFYCPNYRELASQLYNQLLIDYGHEIDIIKIISDTDELSSIKFDLLITTVQKELFIPQEIIIIPPFVKSLDKIKAFSVIEKIRKTKKNYILRKCFNTIFFKELFVANINSENRKQVIHILTEKMRENDYVDDNFEKQVLIREKAASTAFGTIAIPHSVKMDAIKTCISVATSNKGIVWNNNKVNIILLIAINKADKKQFHELYEALVELFSNDSIIEKTKSCKKFEDFQHIIYAALQNEIEKWG
ncbi:MAG: PTS sugar transporter subunit IIA, partial [Malacoplasma sp.]